MRAVRFRLGADLLRHTLVSISSVAKDETGLPESIERTQSPSVRRPVNPWACNHSTIVSM